MSDNLEFGVIYKGSQVREVHPNLEA